MRITSHGFITKARKVTKITKLFVFFVFFVTFVKKPSAVTAP
jgi:hypothetical protein